MPPLLHPQQAFGSTTIDFSRRIAVMAIINRTPDSFFDQGATFALDAAVNAAVTAVDAGADMVDIGGAKFAPGPPIPPEAERDRVVPVVTGLLARRPGAVVSVDTFQPLVADEALAAGALIINDTTALHDPTLAEIAASYGAHLVITHSLARPRTSFPHPRYEDVTGEVRTLLERKVKEATGRGLPDDHIIVDPGHDLNKNTVDTLELTNRMAEIASLGYPTLAAVSRKDFIGESLDLPKEERLTGSIAAAVACALAGARVVRMHDVGPSIDAMRMTEAILGMRRPPHPVHNM